MKLIIVSSFIGFISFFLIQCSSDDLNESNSAKAAFDLAQKFEKDERFEEALIKYNEVKNKHPYSRYAVEAKFQIAGIHYKREAWLEAQHAYQLFKELHPKHKKIDFVTFRLAMSYFNQLPSSIDRDLSQSKETLLYFNEFLTSYPSSSHYKEAKQRQEETLKKLAQKELYIAEFYYVRDHHESALGRLDNLLKSYPGLGFDKKALSWASISAIKIGEKSKALYYHKELKNRYPDSGELAKTESELNKHGLP